MAEFKYVMMEFIRGRKHMGKKDAPLIRKSADELTEKDIEQLEYEVMKYAEEHPKLKKPTWLEFLVDQGVLSSEFPMSSDILNYFPSGWRMHHEIPDDIYELYKNKEKENG